ncbi:hypothetical protein G6F59_015189 [Rhizopus arrhizus]|nr:hypothetical protein G6F59_015189 [Rhizopus arrhizus]
MDQRLPAVRLNEVQKQVDGSGLAGAIGAEQAIDLARLDAQMQRMQRDLITVTFGQADGFKHYGKWLGGDVWRRFGARMGSPGNAV